MAEDRPPFRYDARLAGEIERRWQERWEREGTFRAQDPRRHRAAQVLPARLLPLPQRHRAARRASAGLHRHRRVRPLPAHDWPPRAAPVRLRHLRAARRAVRDRHRPASGRHRPAERGRHAPPAAPAGTGARSQPRDHDQRSVLLPLDAVDLPAHLQQLVRPGGRTGPPGRRPDRRVCVGPARHAGRPPLARSDRGRAGRCRRCAPAGLPVGAGRQLVPGPGHGAGRRGGDRRRPQRGRQLPGVPQAAAPVDAAHHRVRRAAAGRPGRGGLAGARQAPAAELDRPERRPLPPEGLAVLPAALLGRAVPCRLRRGRPGPGTGRSRCPRTCCR